MPPPGKRRPRRCSLRRGHQAFDPRAELLRGTREGVVAVPPAARAAAGAPLDSPVVRHLGGRGAGRAARADAAQLRPGGWSVPVGRPRRAPLLGPDIALLREVQRFESAEGVNLAGIKRIHRAGAAGGRAAGAAGGAGRAAAGGQGRRRADRGHVHASYRRDLVPVDPAKPSPFCAHNALTESRITTEHMFRVANEQRPRGRASPPNTCSASPRTTTEHERRHQKKHMFASPPTTTSTPSPTEHMFRVATERQETNVATEQHVPRNHQGPAHTDGSRAAPYLCVDTVGLVIPQGAAEHVFEAAGREMCRSVHGEGVVVDVVQRRAGDQHPGPTTVARSSTASRRPARRCPPTPVPGDHVGQRAGSAPEAVASFSTTGTTSSQVAVGELAQRAEVVEVLQVRPRRTHGCAAGGVVDRSRAGP